MQSGAGVTSRWAFVYAGTLSLGVLLFSRDSFSVFLALAALPLLRSVAIHQMRWLDFVVCHGLLTILIVLAVYGYVRLSVGSAPGWPEEAQETLRASWVEGDAWSRFAQYALVRIAAFAAIVFLGERLLLRHRPSAESFARLFVSLAVIQAPIEYVLRKPLSSVGVFRSEGSEAFVFAAGILGLEYSIPLIVLVALLLLGVILVRSAASGVPERAPKAS
jgi:hypothetical protein